MYHAKFEWVIKWIFLLLCYGSAIFIFQEGFLLKKTSLSYHSKCEDFPSQRGVCWNKPKYEKAILIVIDALRFDFIDPSNKIVTPYTGKLSIVGELLRKEPQNTLVSKFIADPPTTTLQRLKGLTTGSLPTFIEMANNFDASSIDEDNLIDQLVSVGKNVTFMGDDTWTSLFNGKFNKQYPAPSFDVQDLDTVDNMVLDHLFEEIQANDSTLLIGHFLGVDHCGHRFGPNNRKMSEKLSQMNEALKKVIKMIDNETLLIVLGDHGMSLKGDHGGDSENEVTAGFFAYSKKQLVYGERLLEFIMDKPIKEICSSQSWSLSTALIDQQNDAVVDEALVFALPFVVKNPFKISVAKWSNCIVTVTPERILRINVPRDEKTILKSHIKLKPDILHDQAILQYSDSGHLIFLTRAFGFLDIFDKDGVFLNTLKLSETMTNIFDSINCIQSIVAENADYIDKLYMLQSNGLFTCSHISIDGSAEYIFSMDVNATGYINSFVILPKFNLLVTSSPIVIGKEIGSDAYDYGISVYRGLSEESHAFKLFRESSGIAGKVDAFVGLFSGIKKMCSVISFSVNLENTMMAFLLSNGQVFIADLPSMKIRQLLDPANCFKTNETFFKVGWNMGDEINLLTSTGDLYQDHFDQFIENVIKGESKLSLKNCLNINGVCDGIVSCFEGVDGQDFYPLNRDVVNPNVSFFFLIFSWVFLIYQKMYLMAFSYLKKDINQMKHQYKHKKINLAVKTIKNTTFEVYLKKLLAQKDYAKAKEIAKDQEWFDLDNINKLQWSEAKKADMDSIQILRDTQDKEWVVLECMKCTFNDINFQEQLLLICMEEKDKLDDKLKFGIEHHSAIFEICKEIGPQFYNKSKNTSMLKLGIELLRKQHFELFKSFVQKYESILHPYILVMLTFIPEGVNVERYRDLLPKVNGEDTTLFEYLLSPKYNEVSENEKNLVEESWMAIRNQKLSTYIVYLENSYDTCLTWFIDRILSIDETTGLANYSHSLAKIGKMHGFSELEEYIVLCQYYLTYLLRLNGILSTSLQSFMIMDSSSIGESVIKSMNVNQIIEKMDILVSIFKWFECRHENYKVSDDMTSIMDHYSRNSLKPLHYLYENYPDLLTVENIAKCLCTSGINGKALIDACRDFSMDKNVISALVVFNQHEFRPTLSQVTSAQGKENRAWNLMMLFIKSADCKTALEWESLVNDIFDIRSLLFINILPVEKVNKLLLVEMLDLIESIDAIKIPIALIKDRHEITDCEMAQIILEKSTHFLNMAMPNIHDENLFFAKQLLMLIPDDILKDETAAHRTNLDIVNIALELGSESLPATIQFKKDDTLLKELVLIGDNYKKVKRLGDLSKLLDLKPPVTKAMAICTEQALAKKDASTIRNYIEQLIRTSKNNTTLYCTCKKIWKSNILKERNDDLIACMMLNCSNEMEISETFDIVNGINVK
uniref:GPI ethanolamine phosphate transferase 3 n=1 Tax=Rhabditophanes sp. KR3021 TaxID=114890 RepID=A0AC35TN32_9BILA